MMYNCSQMQNHYIFTILFGILITIFYNTGTSPVFAQTINTSSNFAVIINQIRGQECCSEGSLEHTKMQLENAIRYKLPTTFVLRYDALTDKRYTDLILSYKALRPDLINTGVMVEIVPSLINSTKFQIPPSTGQALRIGGQANSKCENVERDSSTSVGMTGQEILNQAQDDKQQISPILDTRHLSRDQRENMPAPRSSPTLAGEVGDLGMKNIVDSSNQKINQQSSCLPKYQGSAETWFQAQNAFTIGYPIEYRKVILDTLLNQYHAVFGKYPTVGSAWMIDTDSVNYLHDKYGVKAFQITREQWGTDSYTLYGGPPHFPYLASRGYLMAPAEDPQNSTLIIRQTVTDPLYNYGDTTSANTSKPNDYARSNRDLTYFSQLIDNAISQKPKGFVNIGLENSMDIDYQNEYDKQLAYIAKLQDEAKLQVVSPDQLITPFTNQKISAYSMQLADKSAIWITTPTYRVRLIQNGQMVMITDIRIYSSELIDPYNKTVAKHEGYWVMPFLIDGSRWHIWKDLKKVDHKFIPVINDFQTVPTSLVISNSALPITTKLVDGRIDIVTTDGLVLASFEEKLLSLAKQTQYDKYVAKQYPIGQNAQGELEWYINGGQIGWGLKKVVCHALCSYKPYINPSNFDVAVAEQYPYLYPESVDRKLSPKYTKVDVTNRFAIADRNPVRLVLEPHDELNFPIILNTESQIDVSPTNTEIHRLGELVKSQQQYLDLLRKSPGIVRVKITMQQDDVKYDNTQYVFFAPNCKNNIVYCLRNPIQGLGYTITKLSDWMVGRK